MPQRLEWTIDVNAPLNTIQTPTLLMQGDDQANTFAVRVTDKGRSYDLSRYTVSAWVERRDGVRVPVDGTVEGNVAEVTLTESCYRVSGRYVAFVRITNADTGEKRTILRLTGMIETEGSGPVLDEEDIIPSIEDIVAMITVMEQATADANAAASNANAAAASAAETAAVAADNANRVAQEVQNKLDSGELVGKGLQILGYYDTADELAAGVTSPEAGDAYGVGTGEPYDIYVWNALNAVWVNNGAIQGPQGEQGVPGATGPQGSPGRDGASARRNLLDNSDFRNPVNQRGAESYTGSVYSIDRWRSWNDDNTVTVSDNCITISGNAHFAQYVNADLMEAGKTYTCAVKMKNGAVYVASGVYPMSDIAQTDVFRFILSDAEESNVTINAGGEYEWAALYEGEYTADTLPEYIPKGYTAELMECQRYYLKLEGSVNVVYPAYSVSATQADVTIPVAVPMRITPTLTVGDVSGISVYTSTTGGNATAAVVQGRRDNAISLRVTADVSTAWRNACARFNTTVELSADL